MAALTKPVLSLTFQTEQLHVEGIKVPDDWIQKWDTKIKALAAAEIQAKNRADAADDDTARKGSLLLVIFGRLGKD